MRQSRISELKKYFRDLFRLSSFLASLTSTDVQHTNHIHDLRRRLVTLEHEQSDTLKKYQKLNKDITAVRQKVMIAGEESIDKVFSDNHQFDKFYKAFEDKFRGSEDEILHRLKEHLPLLESLPQELKELPIIDIGCGRGEFLSLLQSSNLKGVGVDTNETMVEYVITKGLEAYATDAFDYLSQAKERSLAAITGFHIVEHIPFESLMALFSEAHRCLAVNGFVLFETPNPETFSVGSHTFYLDPSHLRPIPPQLLAFMLEYVGFTCEIIRLHPIEELPIGLESLYLKKLHTAAFGPADYAVVGRKSTTTNASA